jgi:hypothetical protein
MQEFHSEIADTSAETVGEVLQSENAEFQSMMDGDAVDTPLPLRGWICGRNKFMGITIPRMDKTTSGGVLIPVEAQARTNACQIVKLSRDIPTWEQDKEDCFRELCEIRDKYPTEYATGAIMKDGPIITYLPGNCEIMPFPCAEPDTNDPVWGWLNRFWSPKGVNNRYPGIEFVSVYFGSCLTLLKHFTWQRVDNDELTRQAMNKINPHSAGSSGLITSVSPGFMVTGGLSPNRM